MLITERNYELHTIECCRARFAMRPQRGLKVTASTLTPNPLGFLGSNGSTGWPLGSGDADG